MKTLNFTLIAFFAGTLVLPGQEERIQLYENIQWGDPTNGVAMGLLTEMESPNSQANNLVCNVFLKNTTGHRLMFFLPKEPQRFDAHLYDSLGKEVARTRRGDSLGQPIPARVKTDAKANSKFQRVFLRPKEITWSTQVAVNRFFKIEKAGNYRLELEQRLFQLNTANTNWVLKAFSLPKVVQNLDLR